MRSLQKKITRLWLVQSAAFPFSSQTQGIRAKILLNALPGSLGRIQKTGGISDD